MSFVPIDPTSAVDAVVLPLSHDEALVLLDWLVNLDLEAVPVRHPAEKQALLELLLRLDAQVAPATLTEADVESARRRLGQVQPEIDRAADRRETGTDG
ncbi:hypothetical protein [Nocardioides sp. AX2bis]|uniref:hypothetical protein n=1 Tax=Nocardioides sp. AX2bis TaxID=2653157 RepID=UPI0012F3E29A|nr:hypothetical protein [Nocardioides sp. AX2bis]VXB28585.1 hypothetical protein NOCARDAX2BIS_200009 [Nocardioides sp. AX2bis]